MVTDYRGKRLLDLATVTLLAVPAILLGALCAIAIRLDTSGPVLFRQPRVGRGGQPFVLLKFRTLVHSDDPGPILPAKDDGRITRVGRVLRRLSLDELPQLVNVARGEMSLVGPRPTLAYQVERYTPEQRGRLSVRPGLTGLAQVRGRNSLDWPSRIVLDLEYVRRQSLALDLAILARSVPALLGGRGVTGHPEDDPIARA